MSMIEAKNFFNDFQKNEILKAIKVAEKNTSGEIRVHIENYCKKSLLDRASEVFSQLEMHKTELRNGVLFYLAIKDRSFAIIGDAGINKVVPKNFWNDVKETVLENFKKGEFSIGLSAGIGMAGEKLQEFFPYSKDDINELPDNISYGND